uniref:Angel homolog 1 (Drosophila) n=1 Tax=Eptatretus burgeri TaxID=7764 RepID=A0A8C4R6V0_EPTBU
MNKPENVGSEACNRSSDLNFESLTQRDDGPGPLGMANAKITSAGEQNVKETLDINWEEPNFLQAPLWRTWEDLSQRHRVSAPSMSEDGLDQPGVSRGFEFSLLCYNILAQRLLEENSSLYTHCIPEALCWKDRRKLLLRELSSFDADILCLQEVQEDHFEEDLKLLLQERGYGCVYKRRTGNRPDGCAICYKTKRMELVASHEMEFVRPYVNVLSKDNVGLAVLLRPLEDPRVEPFCVTNTHLLYNPWRGDIKLAQIALLFAELHRFLGNQASNLRFTNRLPLILCGDFNSLPFSPLYRFVQDSLLHYNGLLSSKVSGQNKISPFNWHLLPSPLLPRHLGIGSNCCYFEQPGYNGGARPAVVEQKRIVEQISQMGIDTSDDRVVSPARWIEVDGTAVETNTILTPKLDNGSISVEKGVRGTVRRRYNRITLLALRWQTACVQRPPNLLHLRGVTVSDEGELFSCKTMEFEGGPSSLKQNSTISHPFHLTSVYSHVISRTGKLEATIFNSGQGQTVDYIFYSANLQPQRFHRETMNRRVQDGRLQLVARLSLPNEIDIHDIGGLPNIHCPSDHIPLAAQFRLLS